MAASVKTLKTRPMLCAIIIGIIQQGCAVIESAEEPPSRPPWQRPSMLPPMFLNNTSQRIVSPVGRPAHLHCSVQQLGDKTVSWVRKRDLHILTVGMFTYTRDQRFQALHSLGSTEWTLKLLAPTFNDSGIYECQVSAEPKISRPFQLEVVVSRARIFGGKELHIRAGSDVNLTCHVTHRHDPIYWYRNDQVINYRHRNRIHLSSRDGISRLHIMPVLPSDSGNYTCAPISATSASVSLHVISVEEPPAAMQHNGVAMTDGPAFCILPVLTAGLLLQSSRVVWGLLRAR